MPSQSPLNFQKQASAFGTFNPISPAYNLPGMGGLAGLSMMSPAPSLHAPALDPKLLQQFNPASMNLDSQISMQSFPKPNLQQIAKDPPKKPINKPLLQNIVSMCNLQCKLDLKKIALNARNTEYNPK